MRAAPSRCHILRPLTRLATNLALRPAFSSMMPPPSRAGVSGSGPLDVDSVLEQFRSHLVRNRPADRRRGLSARVLSYSLLSLTAVWLVTLPQPAQAQAYDPRYPVCMKRYQGPFGSEWID